MIIAGNDAEAGVHSMNYPGEPAAHVAPPRHPVVPKEDGNAEFCGVLLWLYDLKSV